MRQERSAQPTVNGTPHLANLMMIFVKAVCFLVAVIFVALIALAQSGCPFMACHGPEGDGWMLPFFFAPVGLPGLIACILFAVSGLVRLRSRP